MTWVLLLVVLGSVVRARFDRRRFEHELRVLELKVR